MRSTLGLLAPLLLASLFGVGCDRHTCENACSQYYGTADGECGRQSVLTNGTTQEAAERNCVDECQVALYNTAVATGSDTDAGGYARLENEADAHEFIECIVDKDFSEAVFAETCEDLFFDCPWIKW